MTPSADQILEQFGAELVRQEYLHSTVKSYLSGARAFLEYFRNSDLRELTDQEIGSYVKFLSERKHQKSRTVHQAVVAVRLLYEMILRVPFRDSAILLPHKGTHIPEILEPQELLTVLGAIKNTKHRMLITLMYSSGLRPTEALRLRPEDINWKEKKVHVRIANERAVRQPVLSDKILESLKTYVAKEKPTKWLFPSRSPGIQLSMRTTQKVFTTAARTAGIQKSVSLRHLRHSFAVHLYDAGYDMPSIERVLGLTNIATSPIMHLLKARTPKKDIPSPFDQIVSGPLLPSFDTTALENAVQKVKSDDERDYLNEAITCFKAGALRAGVIFAWTGAIRNIQQRCLGRKRALNTYIRSINPNARMINSINDFSYFKDKTILQASEEVDIYDKGEREALEDCLRLRNKCGHPGKYKPQPNKITAYIEELVSLVFS